MSFSQLPAGVAALLAESGGSVGWSGSFFVVDAAPGPPAEAEIRLISVANAVEQVRLNLPDGIIGSWGTGSLDISDYDFQFQILAGSLNSPGTQPGNTWINGFAGMYWGVRENGFGVSSCQGNLLIRPAGGGATIDSTLANVQAETV